MLRLGSKQRNKTKRNRNNDAYAAYRNTKQLLVLQHPNPRVAMTAWPSFVAFAAQLGPLLHLQHYRRLSLLLRYQHGFRLLRLCQRLVLLYMQYSCLCCFFSRPPLLRLQHKELLCCVYSIAAISASIVRRVGCGVVGW